MARPNLEAVRAWFLENFEKRGELGASVSIWHEGREILSLAAGFADRQKTRPWEAATPVLVWSATKGPAAAALHHALQKNGESLETPVVALWPEFGKHGKERLTIGDLMAHRAGVAALDQPVSVTDLEAVVRAIEEQDPNWPLGQGPGHHGYHPRTFGALLDHLVRQLEGVSLGDYWRTHFAVPMGLDFWIGLPPELNERVAPIYAARAGGPRSPHPEDEAFYRALANPETLTAHAFSSPKGLAGVAAMNTPEVRALSLPGFGGIGTAHALAKFYAMLAEGGIMEGIRYFPSCAPMEKVRSTGEDRVLLRQTAFAAGFMKDPVGEDGRKLREIFGPSLRAFGQPGAGGAHAFADPENRLAFAYVMNQMEASVLPNEKALGLVRALYS